MSLNHGSWTVSISDNAEYKLESFKLPQCYQGDLKAVLIPRGLITDRIKCLAQEICCAIGDKPLTLLCVLKASFRFFTELVEELITARASYSHLIEFTFAELKSYKNMESAGKVDITLFPNADELKDKNVLVVEGIIDSGRTMSQVLSILDNVGVREKWTAVLLSKRTRRAVKVQEDFVAFDIPDNFVVGYGLDYNQKFRDLEHVCVLNENGIERHKL